MTFSAVRVLRGIAIAAITLISTASFASTIAHWDFENGSPGLTATGTGTVLDVSGNGHHGNPLNGPVYQSVPGGGTGLRFDGSNDRVFVADSTDFVSNSLTVEAIISLDALPGGSRLDQIVFRGDSRAGVDPFYLGILGDRLRFYIEGPDATALHSPDPLPINELIHVAGTIDDATGFMGLYINGNLVASQTTVRRPTVPIFLSQGAGIGIGNLQDGGNQYLDGLIDEVRISDMALNPGQFLGAAVAAPAPGSLMLLAIGLIAFAMRSKFSTANVAT